MTTRRQDDYHRKRARAASQYGGVEWLGEFIDAIESNGSSDDPNGGTVAMQRVNFDVTDSTNVQARRIAAQYPGECVLVTAAQQTAGRGRNGRQWQSPRGGAWMSLAWPMRNAPGTYATASLVAAVSVLRAVSEIVPECADLLQVKWPNDLLLRGRKVAGILCEQTLGGTANPSAALLIGVGVNVDFDVAVLPPDLRHPATTLRQESNRAVMVEHVVNGVTACLIQLLSDFESEGLSEALVEELQSRLAYIGMIRTFDIASHVASGRIAGIDPLGRLMIQCVGGDIAITAGELLNQEDDTGFVGHTDLRP